MTKKSILGLLSLILSPTPWILWIVSWYMPEVDLGGLNLIGFLFPGLAIVLGIVALKIHDDDRKFYTLIPWIGILLSVSFFLVYVYMLRGLGGAVIRGTL